MYSGPCRYRGTNGNIVINSDGIQFIRTDGLISQRQVLVIKIPLEAIQNVSCEGALKKKVVLIVDGRMVPGIPRHEFETSDFANIMSVINYEVANRPKFQPQASSNQTIQYKETVREVVKIYCMYCGALNEMKDCNCSICGAPLGKH